MFFIGSNGVEKQSRNEYKRKHKTGTAEFFEKE